MSLISPAARKVQSLALVGTYVPRQCGIATFTRDLHQALREEDPLLNAFALALDDIPEGYRYPPEVRFQIRAHRLRDYDLAADLLNINQVDAVILQHEYGIFGGNSGDYVLALARNLRMPLITTLHTILKEPNAEQEAILKELARVSDRVVTMSRLGAEFLRDIYRVPESKIAFIPHGIPDVPFVDPAFYKDQFGLESRQVLLTFGLLSPGKGIEVAIRALPRIVAEHPDVVYVVLGATHPHILKREGNAYLHGLQRLAAQLGVENHVIFHNRYVSLDELCGYIGAADIYITPYLNEAQIVSGTLSYALGMGKAVVSTPYWYAQEMLADGRGCLFPFGDSDALAEIVMDLLRNPVRRNAMRKKAYLAGRSMTWKEVGRSYLMLANEVLLERSRHPRPVFYFRQTEPLLEGVPEVHIDHMVRLTDDTGIYQHAVYSVPDRRHGYCTDDNSRALIAALRYYRLSEDEAALRLVPVYLSFLHHAFNPETGKFRNFMSFDRQWLDDEGSEDVQGRTLWALGQAVANAPDEATLAFAVRLFNEALPRAEDLQAPRACAFAIVGIHAYLQRFSGDALARRVRKVLSDRLFRGFQEHATADWPWLEDVVTYANARIPHALIMSGRWIPDHKMLEQGLRSLEWLLQLQILPDGRVSLIGNRGWLYRNGDRARFDQQPLEVMHLVEACAEAYRCTGEERWLDYARTCFNWFLGNNDTQSMLYDPVTKGCRDGLHEDGPNLNQGAESTLAWLISLLAMHELEQELHLREAQVKASAEAAASAVATQ
ncbi:MAG: glycosyltransferase family 4 protein [Acidobacteriota bacterium]